jgi:hypothetical protein
VKCTRGGAARDRKGDGSCLAGRDGDVTEVVTGNTAVSPQSVQQDGVWARINVGKAYRAGRAKWAGGQAVELYGISIDIELSAGGRAGDLQRASGGPDQLLPAPAGEGGYRCQDEQDNTAEAAIAVQHRNPFVDASPAGYCT